MLFDAASAFRLADHRLDFWREHADAIVVKRAPNGLQQGVPFAFERGPLALEFGLCLACGHEVARRCQRHLAKDQRVEERLHRVIVGLRHRVEHVVVAFRAGDGHAQECAGNGVDRIHGQLLGIGPGAARQKAQGKQIAWAGLSLRSMARRRHLGALGGAASGELDLHELVVGQVFV